MQVGLAVDDIKGIQEAATLKRLEMRVRLRTSDLLTYFNRMPSLVNMQL